VYTKFLSWRAGIVLMVAAAVSTAVAQMRREVSPVAPSFMSASNRGASARPVLLASLRPTPGLVWQRVRTPDQPLDGPILYQIIFRSSATPGHIPRIANNFTLTNSLISDNGSQVAIGGLSIDTNGIVSFANGQTFPSAGGVNSVTAGNNFITIAGTATNPTVALNTSISDARYLQLGGGTMTGAITFANGQTFPGTGTVTSVSTGAGLTGGPITNTGTISISNNAVTNGMLQNSSLTVATGSGLSGGGAVPLGGVLTLSNTGVLSVGASGPLAATAGANPVISLTGSVPIANGGTGVTTAPGNAGQYLRSSGPATWAVGAIQSGDLPSLSGTYVDLANTQVVAGAKTFNQTVTVDTTSTFGEGLFATSPNSFFNSATVRAVNTATSGFSNGVLGLVNSPDGFAATLDNEGANCLLNPECRIMRAIGGNGQVITMDAGGYLNGSGTTLILQNEGVTGTVTNLIAKLAPANPQQVMKTATTDTGGALGIVTAFGGKAGISNVAVSGVVFCQFDAGGSTYGHYVTISPITAGNCHDAGASYPVGVQVLGRVFGSTTAGPLMNQVLLFGPELGAMAFSGNQTFNGTVAATSFSGNGSALTNLNGANVTSAVASATNAAQLGGVAAANYARLDIGNNFTGNQNLGSGTITMTVANNNGPGTLLHDIASLTATSPARAFATPAANAGGVVGIVVAGNGISGNAQIAVIGQTTCEFDGPTTAGDYVTISQTILGDCMDVPNGVYPTGTQVLGRALVTSGGAAPNFQSMILFGPEARGPSLVDINGNPLVAIPTASPHTVLGTATANVFGVAVVTFTGAAAFSNASSFRCTGNDTSNPNFAVVGVARDTGTGIQLFAPSGHVVDFMCTGS
jgi:hypothetical protein